MCEITHCAQNYTRVPFAFNVENVPSLEKFYTDAYGGISDKWDNVKLEYLVSDGAGQKERSGPQLTRL